MRKDAAAAVRRRRWLPMVLVLLAIAAPVHADWKRDYELGLRAVAQGDWAEAERRMRAAIADDAEPNARKRFQGVKFDRYVPQWYAGLAAFRQGDCERAAGYWNDAASRRVVASIDELAAEQRRLSAECASRSASRTAAAPVQDAPTTKPPASTAAEPTASSAAPATRPATPAKTVTTTAPPPASAPQRTIAAQKPPARPVREPPAKAVAASPDGARAVAPPAALRSALEAFLAGRYDEVVRSDPAALADARARSQLLLLRAAARFVQAELAGSGEAALAAAREDVRAARSGAAPALDQALYPPRFRAFVAATR